MENSPGRRELATMAMVFSKVLNFNEVSGAHGAVFHLGVRFSGVFSFRGLHRCVLNYFVFNSPIFHFSVWTRWSSLVVFSPPT